MRKSDSIASLIELSASEKSQFFVKGDYWNSFKVFFENMFQFE